MAFSDKTQFDYLYDALAKKYPGIINSKDKNTLFQFATTPIAAQWLSGNDSDSYTIANAGSSNLDGFYVPVGGAIDTSYQQLIKTIKPTSKDINKRYRELSQKIQAKTDEYRYIRDSALSDYNVWKENNCNSQTGIPFMNFYQWLDDLFGGIKWKKDMTQKEFEIGQYTSEQASIAKTMDAALFDALDRISEGKIDTMNISANGQAVTKVPKVTISGSLVSDKGRWVNYQNDQYDFDVLINARETITHPWITTYDTSVSGNCFRMENKVNVNTKRIIQDAHYNLRVRAVGLQSYNITRGAWYSESFVNPEIELLEGATLTNDSFFGPMGSLHLIPLNVLVMYKPDIELTISSNCYQEELSAYSDVKVGWFEIFGFRLSFGAAGKLQPVKNGDNTVTIKIASPDTAIPQIVGVLSEVKYNNHK